MVAGCGPKIAKFFLFILNFCIWLCGLVLIGGGAYVTAKHYEFQDLFADNTILTVSWTSIGIGIFIFIVGFSGCCGAIKESSCLLHLYFMFVLLIVLAEVSLGILAFLFSSDIEEGMMEGMQRTINDTYGLKDGATTAVDDVQRTFDCCGASGTNDYTYSKYLTEGIAVPTSCCKVEIVGCSDGIKGQPIYPDRVWQHGCVSATKDTIKYHYVAIGGAAFGLIIFQILTMVFACCVIKGINNDSEYDKFV